MKSTNKRIMRRELSLGSITLGGAHPIAVQTMLQDGLQDTASCIEKIHYLKKIGCDIVRLAVRDSREIGSVKSILQEIDVPLVADIQFKMEHALEAIREGFHGIRINPGYLRERDKILEILDLAGSHHTAIRIGYNSGSLPADVTKRIQKGMDPVQSIMISVQDWEALFDQIGFTNYKYSLKSSQPLETLVLNRELSKITKAPIHLGVTEAGTLLRSAVRSSFVMGTLLSEGIGDTIRVSITGGPEEEIQVAREILRCVEIDKRGINIVSCPTCSRCQVELQNIVDELAMKTMHIHNPITVAIMGCAVNGPGEAKHADLGIAGFTHDLKARFALFKKGQRIENIDASDAVTVLLREIENHVK